MKRLAILSAIAFVHLIGLPSIASGEMANGHQDERRGLTTTLKLLANTVPEEFKRLYKAHDGIAEYGLETPITILTILETNGLDSALASLRAVPEDQAKERDRVARLFAADCAERVIPLWSHYFPNDSRPQKAIEVARRYAEGQANDDELAAAWVAAEDATKDELASARAAYGTALVDARFADKDKKTENEASVKGAEEAFERAVIRLTAKKAARAALVTTLVTAENAAWNTAWNAAEAAAYDAEGAATFVATFVVLESKAAAEKAPIDAKEAAWATLRKAARAAAKDAGVAAKKAAYVAAKEAVKIAAMDAVIKATKKGDAAAEKAAWTVWYDPDKDASVAAKKAVYDAAKDTAIKATKAARDAVVNAVRDAEHEAQVELLRKYL